MPAGPTIGQPSRRTNPANFSAAAACFCWCSLVVRSFWRLKYRVGRKEKLLAIGSYDRGVSLKKAREEHDKATPFPHHIADHFAGP